MTSYLYSLYVHSFYKSECHIILNCINFIHSMLYSLHIFISALNFKHFIFLQHISSLLFIRTPVNLGYDILSHDIHGNYFNFIHQHIIKFKTSSVIPSFPHVIYFEYLIFHTMITGYHFFD